MPFPNEHAARQANPGDFTSFRRDNKPKGTPKGISFIYGIKAGRSRLQSIRFARTEWTVTRAREWLKAHKFKTTIEPATKTGPAKKGLWGGAL